MTRIAFLTPPVIKPCEPGLSAAAAAAWMSARGVDALALDASQGWFQEALSPGSLARSLELASQSPHSPGRLEAFRMAQRDHGSEALRRMDTYLDRRKYTSAVSRLTNALALASIPTPPFQLRIGDLAADRLRPHCSADLLRAAELPGPFDEYILGTLLPDLERRKVTHVGISLSFLHQAFGAWRVTRLLADRMPSVQRWLGGPLVACWKAAEANLDSPAFQDFHRVVAADTEDEMSQLAVDLGGQADGPETMMAPDLDHTPWETYLVPQPTIPVALGRGCYWRRCTFCPDHLHPAYHPSRRDTLGPWLHAVATRFPQGAMLHFTDSACAPNLLERVADVILRDRLPIRWHGFARMEARFGDPDFTRHLAAGGGTMLQWGLETASTRMLDLLEKGVDPQQARNVLRSASQAGIRSHAYLLFGLPQETDTDRQATLDFVRQESTHLHDLNLSILNLPRRSPMHRHAAQYGITELSSFGEETDLSLYDDFRCGPSHPRLEARRWLGQVFQRDPVVKDLLGNLNAPFKSNHGCFFT